MASPMPVAPPVIMATLPSRRLIYFVLELNNREKKEQKLLCQTPIGSRNKLAKALIVFSE
jgi:hypothetical protein